MGYCPKHARKKLGALSKLERTRILRLEDASYDVQERQFDALSDTIIDQPSSSKRWTPQKYVIQTSRSSTTKARAHWR